MSSLLLILDKLLDASGRLALCLLAMGVLTKLRLCVVIIVTTLFNRELVDPSFQLEAVRELSTESL